MSVVFICISAFCLFILPFALLVGELNKEKDEKADLEVYIKTLECNQRILQKQVSEKQKIINCVENALRAHQSSINQKETKK